MSVDLSFRPNDKVILIKDGETIEFLDLYRSIRDWEASFEGITHPTILEGAGNIPLPDGSKTARCMILVNGWRLASEGDVSIINGYVTGREGSVFRDPLLADSKGSIRLLGDAAEESRFVPTDAQKRYVLEQSDLFSEDWEIITRPAPLIRRKPHARNRSHKVLGLYWFLKREFLRDAELRKLSFPISGDNEVPREGHVRQWEWSSTWKIDPADLPFLYAGPLFVGEEELVPPDTSALSTAENEPLLSLDSLRQATPHPPSPGDKVRRALLRAVDRLRGLLLPRISARDDGHLKESVTIGVVTALPAERAAVLHHIDSQSQYAGLHGSKKIPYIIGTIPAFGGGHHTVAVVLCEMGNNAAAIQATIMTGEFPNIREVVMVGIAGAVPNPTKPETHVRLGDVVVSGSDGVVKYDFVKETKEAKEARHKPRPPSAQLIDSMRRLESGLLLGHKPWMDHFASMPELFINSRPATSSDVLGDSKFPNTSIPHPHDPVRVDDEPRLFMGRIGAADILLKNPEYRDQLRDKFGILAVEMESSGISDAAYFAAVPYFVIRGTCDYCDANKNDAWHLYAAAIASSVFRTLMEETPPHDRTV